jgi:hypothetical protein
MWIVGTVTLVAALATGHGPGPARHVGVGGWALSLSVQQDAEPRIWLDRGADPVLEAGDRVRISYRTDVDAYVAVLQIDTDGTTRMLYPRSPTENHYARANRDYRLLFPRSAYWNVDDRPGVGYFFVVTSRTPFDFSDFGYSHYDGGWDLSAVGSTVYEDPYIAMDDYVARLVPDWEEADYGLAVISYDVGGPHEYPRFLCYQCHGFRPYRSWDPYRYSCLDFRVVVYDDPSFYPSSRYPGNRVVLEGPRNPSRPRFEFKERAPGDPGTPIRGVREGTGDSPSQRPDRRGPDQGAGRGRVAAPTVAPRPTRIRAPDLSDSDDSPGPGVGRGKVISPPAGDEVPRRPTLERRRATPDNPGARPRTEVRPRPRRSPAEPTVGSRSARPSQGAQAGRRAKPAPGSSSSGRAAPRTRARTPAPSANTTRPRASSGDTKRSSARRPARSGPR